MNASYERPASISSYFDHLPPPRRLLLRVYTAEKLRHVSSHGTYCKIYVGGSEMVRGSGVFSHHSQKLSASTSSLLSRTRGNTTELSTTRRSPLSMSMVNLRGPQNRLRVLKTNVQKGKRPDPVWNERFDIPVLDVNEDVLSIRVKSARLMSSPAIGACSIPLKEFVSYGASTIDRWFDLRLGKKDAGRIRLQLRLVDSSTTRLQDTDSVVVTTQPRNGRGNEPQLSILAEESSQEIAARALKKMSRRNHKYHRAVKRFDGRSLSSSKSSSDGSSKSGSNKRDDQKRAPAITTLRNNSDSATSNESEPTSDISVSPVASERASNEDIKSSGDSMTSAYCGSTRRRELDCNRMKTSSTARTAKIRPSRTAERLSSKRGDDDLNSLDSFTAVKRWTSNQTQLSTLSSISDFRESSRIDYDDDSDDGQSFYAERKTSLNRKSASIALSSSATSTVDHHNDSLFSFSDSDEESEEDVEIKSEKAREHQRQQWQMEQRKMQLARIKEVSRSPSDDDNSLEDEEDESDDGLGRDRASTRIRFTPTLAKLLGRESMNVLFEDEDDTEEEDGLKTYKLSDDFVPMLEACSPRSFDLVDSGLRPSSFD